MIEHPSSETRRPIAGAPENAAALPCKRVELDVVRIDLQPIVQSAEARESCGADCLPDLRPDGDDTARNWLVVTVDCSTQKILGMKLTSNPSTDDALDCPRMAKAGT